MNVTLVFINKKYHSMPNDIKEKAAEIIVRLCKHYMPNSECSAKILMGTAASSSADAVMSFSDIPNSMINIGKIIGQIKTETCSELDALLFQKYGGIKKIVISEMPDANKVSCGQTWDNVTPASSSEEHEELDYAKRALQYRAEAPKFSFERLVLSDSVRERINEAVTLLEYRDKLFSEWGLASIMSPSVLINFYGESGTGKTMAAEAIAHKLGKKIIRASYADIESKYHGEGPKMLKAIFLAAQQQDAVLFIDEADSMLSARLSGASSGSEQAINSMRSQLLMSLENFDGIVVFATNLIENYDKAFITRLVCIEMKRPDKEARKQIWNNHLYQVGESDVKLNIPLDKSVDIDELAEKYDFCGRDIRNAVKTACIRVVPLNRSISQNDLIYACDTIKKESDSVNSSGKINIKPVPADIKEKLTSQLKQQ